MSKRSSVRFAVALLSTSLAGLLIAGCSTNDDQAAPSASGVQAAGEWVTPRTMPDGKGSDAPDGQFPRTVDHFLGETKLDAQPKRVIVISTGQADALLTLGIVPAGSTRGDGADLIPPYLKSEFPQHATELGSVADVGARAEPDLEAVASAEPDLILMNVAGKNAEQLYGNLSAIAPTVATQGTGLYWKQDLLLLADAVGKREQAQDWLTTYQDDAAEFGSTLSPAPTVSFLRKNGDRTRVFGVASFTGSVAEDVGLARPESQNFTDKTSRDISGEELALADADWILYGVQGEDASALTGAPLWGTLGGVQTDHAVRVDDDVFYLNVGPTAARLSLAQLETTLRAD